MVFWIVLLLVVFSIVMAIHGDYYGPRRNHLIFKPLTTILITFLAFTATHASSTFYQRLIVLGLIFSLAGDIFLMFPKERFIHGLVSFLLAHVCYIAAFTNGLSDLRWWLLVPFIGYGLALFSQLAAYLGKMRVPVAVYSSLLLIMGWLACGRLLSGFPGGGWTAVGGLFFIASDSILAFDHFRKPFRSAQLLILSTYFIAQLLIAISMQ